MKKTRFTEEQMVTMPEADENGSRGGQEQRRCPLPDDLRLAIDVVGRSAAHLQT
jgi:hypothetical protein